MKRVLQHRISRLYVCADGALSSNTARAANVADFASALRLCNDLRLRNEEYVYTLAGQEFFTNGDFSPFVQAKPHVHGLRDYRN